MRGEYGASLYAEGTVVGTQGVDAFSGGDVGAVGSRVRSEKFQKVDPADPSLGGKLDGIHTLYYQKSKNKAPSD